MAWIESHQSLAKHRKLMRLAALLGVSRVQLVGHLHYLWWWGIDNADIDGHMGDVTPLEIADAAEWEGDAEEFVGALVQVGFLDEDEHGHYVLHDWYDYAGKLNERRAKDRERKRAARGSGNPAEIQRMSNGNPADVRVHQTYLPNQHTSGSIEDRPADTDMDTSGFQPATTTQDGIGDDSVTPAAYFQRLWGVYPPSIDALFESYADKLDPSAIKWAVWEARIAGQRRTSYIRAILDRLVAQGLTTAAAAQKHEEERRATPARASPATNGAVDGVPNADAYRPIDPELVSKYAAYLYGDDEHPP